MVSLYSSTTAAAGITTGVQGGVTLTTFVKTPVYQGAYLLDVTIYDSTYTTVTFTFSILTLITPQMLSTLSWQVYMNF